MQTMRYHHSLSAVLAAASLALAGCATTSSVEQGRDGTIAFPVQIEASDEARVEVNGDYVGNTPATVKIFGDKDGTFHNFGSSDFVIDVIPLKTNLFRQRRVFRTGGWFSQEDAIPKRLYFDLSQKSEGFSLDLPRY